MFSTITVLAIPQIANAEEIDDGFRFLIGYKSMNFSEQSYSHDTHRDDWFLPDSGVPGSAGKTKVDGGNFLAIGLGYQYKVSNPLLLTFDLGVLVGNEDDKRKNANDPRPNSEASFVYSEINWGMFATAEIQYNFDSFYVGMAGQLGVAFIESGWDRYGSENRQDTKLKWVPSGGPSIGYWITKNLAVEGTIQFGQSVDFGIHAIIKY